MGMPITNTATPQGRPEHPAFFTSRELSTILSALRMWQPGAPDTRGSEGADEYLCADEIDELCERLNMADALCDLHIVVTDSAVFLNGQRSCYSARELANKIQEAAGQQLHQAGTAAARAFGEGLGDNHLEG